MWSYHSERKILFIYTCEYDTQNDTKYLFNTESIYVHVCRFMYV